VGTEGRSLPFARALARFGLFEPVEKVGLSSTGARTLLKAASRSAEAGLHKIRGLIWIFFLVGVTTWSGMPALIAVVLAIVLGAAWLAGLQGLQRERWFGVTRLVLIGLDAVFVVLTIAAADPSSPVRALVRAVAPDAPLPDVRAYVGPVLALLAFSGAIRLEMRIAALVTAVALAVYAYSVIALGSVPDEALFLSAVVLLAGVVGMNGVWLLRYIVLHVQERTLLEAYLPEEISKELTTTTTLDRAGRVEELTLLTCDIRGFTTMSEKLSPSDTVAFINAYLEIVCPAIVSAGGVIDKFMGDGVLSFFEGGGHAGRALNAARLIAALSGQVKTKAGDVIRIGVAVHSGEVLVGTIGPRSKREYTIISDTVNTLSRLEELNKKFGSAICVSERTLAAVKPEQRAGFNGPEAVPIRGRAGQMNVYYYKAATQEELEQLKAAADATPLHEGPDEKSKEPDVIYWRDEPAKPA
jgi:class 3 adenylate cyclase